MQASLNGWQASTLPLSAKRAVRFPLGDDGVVYLVKPADFLERAALRRDVAAAGARFHSNEQLLDLACRIIEEAGPANAGAMLEDVEGYRALLAAAQAEGRAPAELDAETAARWAEIEAAMAEVDAYREMMADREHWMTVAPWLAARRFLVGWEGIDLPFKRVNGLVPDALLERLPAGHPIAIGWHAYSLMTPGGQAKNSASPSP